jgi:hypothetical protein
MRKVRITSTGRPLTLSSNPAYREKPMLVYRDGAWSGPITIEGDFTIEEIDENVYVQVVYVGNEYKRYTYIDPSGDLEIGDFAVSDNDSIVKVVSLGKGSYSGPYKALKKRLVTEELTAAA